MKKLAVVGSVVAVAGLGVGGVASAWSGAPAAQAASPTSIGVVAANAKAAPAGTSTATTTKAPGSAGSTPAKKNHKKRTSLAKRLLRVSHAQWVTKNGKTGTFVTHDAVRGEVTAAAPASITIKATDGTSETFVVTGSTKVRVTGHPGTIGQVKVGDRAAVLGTGSGPMTATRIVDRGAPGSKLRQSSTSAPDPTSTPAPTS